MARIYRIWACVTRTDTYTTEVEVRDDQDPRAVGEGMLVSGDLVEGWRHERDYQSTDKAWVKDAQLIANVPRRPLKGIWIVTRTSETPPSRPVYLTEENTWETNVEHARVFTIAQREAFPSFAGAMGGEWERLAHPVAPTSSSEPEPEPEPGSKSKPEPDHVELKYYGVAEGDLSRARTVRELREGAAWWNAQAEDMERSSPVARFHETPADVLTKAEALRAWATVLESRAMRLEMGL